jgi:hypothetical protein
MYGKDMMLRGKVDNSRLMCADEVLQLWVSISISQHICGYFNTIPCMEVARTAAGASWGRMSCGVV